VGREGYQEDVDSGLKLLGHRYYDASTGRFLTRDIARDGRNWYIYCGSNPLYRTDPNGLEATAMGLMWMIATFDPDPVSKVIITGVLVTVVVVVAVVAVVAVVDEYRRESPRKDKGRFTSGGGYRSGPHVDPGNPVHPFPHIDFPLHPVAGGGNDRPPLPPEWGNGNWPVRDPITGRMPGDPPSGWR